MLTSEKIEKGWKRAKQLRTDRESRMDQCYRYAMPGRASFFDTRLHDDIDDVFDETAIVATQEFASRLQSGLTPNFSRWSGLKAGMSIPQEDRDEVNKALDEVTEFVFEVINGSNFGQEVYESYLDCSVSLGALEVVEGSATQPVMFNAIPLTSLWVDNDPFDRLGKFYRHRKMTLEKLDQKYGDSLKLSQEQREQLANKPCDFLEVTWKDFSDRNEEKSEKVLYWPREKAIIWSEEYKGIGSCPIIAFRWSKSAGDVWGQGPLMNALPAIKTCNMVVRMVLENAQMAISGMYNMDDDGAVNVDTIQLVPGTIIPRQPGTQGLTPVPQAGDFNVANIVLDETRSNIKRALYNDMLGNPNRTPMSATEVAERMADLSRQIGAAFGRLQNELVEPVLQRVIYILNKQGLISLPALNGRKVKIVAESPLSQAQAMQDIQQVDRLAEFVMTRFGPQLSNVFLKGEEISGYVGDKLQVPNNLVRSKGEMTTMMQQIAQMSAEAEQPQGEEGEGQGLPI